MKDLTDTMPKFCNHNLDKPELLPLTKFFVRYCKKCDQIEYLKIED